MHYMNVPPGIDFKMFNEYFSDIKWQITMSVCQHARSTDPFKFLEVISEPDYQYGLKIKLHLFLNGTTNIVMYEVQKSIFGY